MSSKGLASPPPSTTIAFSSIHSSVAKNLSLSFVLTQLVILLALTTGTARESFPHNEPRYNSSHPPAHAVWLSSSGSSASSEDSAHPARAHDLPIKWTEQDKVPIAWQRLVRPLIFASSRDTLQVSLPLDSTASLPFTELNFTLGVPQQSDFVSPYFAYAQHFSVVENGEYFTEERQTSGHSFSGQRDNITKLIQKLFDTDSQDNSPEVCCFFTGRNAELSDKADCSTRLDGSAFTSKSKSPNQKAQPRRTNGIGCNLSATFLLCSHGKMNGIITGAQHGHFLVEPKDADQCRVQLRHSTLDNSQVLQACTHKVHFMPFSEAAEHGLKGPNRMETFPSRTKRSVSLPRTIEIMVVTDLSMWKNHGESLQEYVFSLMASVSHIFKHSSIGNQINVKLIKLYAMKNTAEDQQQEHLFLGGSAQHTLRRFCHWQKEHNQEDDADPRHYDIAILLTRRDLCRRSSDSQARKSCDTIGLAHSGQICDPTSSCAIVEDTGLSSAFTIAHELGHVLGIPHDDEEKCKQFYSKHSHQKESNVMARMIDVKSHMWSWSACSKHFITEYLDSGNGNCLLDDNSRDIMAAQNRETADERSTYRGQVALRSLRHQSRSQEPTRFKQPGEYYTATAQCQLMFGKSSQVCSDMPEPECKRLWCTHSGLGCRTQHMPWADGTECSPSEGRERWCQQGNCVHKDVSQMQPLDGGWGEWSPYSECSMHCGGGISQSRRKCDNPSPRNGGKYCLGERIRYKSCNTHACDPPIADIREKQCSEFNGKQVIKNVDSDVFWVPYHTRNPADACKLHCADKKTGNYYQLKERVLDGTPCSPDSYDICVNGKCLSAGCDRILGSNVTLDQCGICGGDSSTCIKISKRLPAGTGRHGYNPVVQIPAGASNILVNKHGSQHKENWLAIRGDDGSYLLNGRWTVNVYARKWHYGGATIEYSGVTTEGERIYANRPIDRSIYIEILCVGELRYPEIEYSYMISLQSPATSSSKPITRYQWARRREWSQCDQMCQGKQERKVACYAITRTAGGDNVQEVHDEYCSGQARPFVEAKACNLECELEWHTEPRGSCSQKCGPGVQYRSVRCIKKTTRGVRFVHDKECAKIGAKPAESEACHGADCIAYHWQLSEWSRCFPSNSHLDCGEGNQTREAKCVARKAGWPDDQATESIVGLEECSHLEPPVTLKQCPKCPQWRVGEWSQCSVTCGHGEIMRTVVCMHGDRPVDEAHCKKLPEPKPDEQAHCHVSCTASRSYSPPEVDDTANYIAINGGPAHSDLSRESVAILSRTSPIALNISPMQGTSFNLISSTESNEHDSSPQPIDGPASAVFSNETIVWRLGKWTDCRCELAQKRYLKKRLVRCIRRLPDYADNQEIPDEFCLRLLSPSLKPLEQESCNPPTESIVAECSLPSSPVAPVQSDRTTEQMKDSSTATLPSIPSVSPHRTSISMASLPATTTSRTAVSAELLPNSSLHRKTVPSSLSSLPPNHRSTPIHFPSAPSPPPPPSSLHVSAQHESNSSINLPSPQSSKQSSPHHMNHNYWTQWSEWGSCIASSGTCGRGTQSREALCAAGQVCQPDQKPANQTRACHRLCPIHEWHYADWSPCSVTCGQGVRTRSAECRDWTNVTVSDHFCDTNKTLPTITESCRMADCNLVWQTGPWSECSQSCDSGMQERSVTCHRRNRYGFVDPRPLPNPVYSLTRRKRGRRNGQQQRASHLSRSSPRHRKRHNNEINYNYKDLGLEEKQASSQWCNLKTKPIEVQSCNFGPCIRTGMRDSFVWRPMPWQPCDRSCGDGKQIRKIICQSVRTGSRVNNNRCKAKLRPERKRPCNLRDCGVTSCLDMRERSRTQQDGEYDLSIQGASVRVFCYGMASLAQPLEYLLLDPAAYEDNFSQLIYRPSDCTSRQVNETPQQINIESERMSTMYFKFVRLNITSLEIIVGDTMFANLKEEPSKSSGSQPLQTHSVLINERSLGFGQALVQGCAEYQQNSIKCHFGATNSVHAKFSINLQKTGLAVAPESHWHRLGPEQFTHRNIKRSKGGQKVEGYCGLENAVHSLVSRTSTCQLGCQPFASTIQLMVP